jgi:hypothetical protein
MRSRLAIEARRELAEAIRLMTPAERLAAFLRHCEQIAALRGTRPASRGEQRRAGSAATLRS